MVLRGDWPARRPEDAATRRRSAEAFLDALVLLHEVDYEAIGLGDLGRPRGFVERQVRRWRERLERARTRDLPHLDEPAEALGASVPPSLEPVIVHNDFKLDNALFDADDPGWLVAGLEGEMATLGDPLIDLGPTLCCWMEPGDPPARIENPGALPPLEGFPSRRELVERSAAARNVDCSRMAWYEIFGMFKIAVVLGQVFVRYERRHTRGPRFAAFETLVPRLAEFGVREGERTGLV